MYEADANDLDMHDIHNGDSVQSEHVTEVPNQSEGRRNQISVANCIGKCLLQILMKHATAVMSPLIYIFFVSGYVTNQHIHQEAHVPLQQNSPTKAAAPQPTDATANAESEQELDHEHSPV